MEEEDHELYDPEDEPPYLNFEQIDFSVLTFGLRELPFFQDDMYLGMQTTNVGLSDAHITEIEYALLQEYHRIEKTPVELAMTVGALSQMWSYGAYEVLRMWRDRMVDFKKWKETGGITPKIAALSANEDPLNLTVEVRKKQLERYRDDNDFRQEIEKTWTLIEPAYRAIELYRINLAKHCAPGKDNAIPRAPGYGRINGHCGALDYELIARDGAYETVSRRDLADFLRACLASLKA